MDITLKLYATLSHCLPETAKKNEIHLKVAEGTSVMDILNQYQVPKENCHLILINGNYTPLLAAEAKILNDGDTLAIWPPVAGG